MRKAFEEQLADNLDVLAGAMRTGHSTMGALSVMVDSAVEPSKSEFRRVLQDEQLGVPLDDALIGDGSPHAQPGRRADRTRHAPPA